MSVLVGGEDPTGAVTYIGGRKSFPVRLLSGDLIERRGGEGFRRFSLAWLGFFEMMSAWCAARWSSCRKQKCYKKGLKTHPHIHTQQQAFHVGFLLSQATAFIPFCLTFPRNLKLIILARFASPYSATLQFCWCSSTVRKASILYRYTTHLHTNTHTQTLVLTEKFVICRGGNFWLGCRVR